jgi:hypothetical protein
VAYAVQNAAANVLVGKVGVERYIGILDLACGG